MGTELKIRCRDLGVDHDSFVSGTSLEDLIDCVEKAIADEGVAPKDASTAQVVRDTVRSALVQSSRPAARRSVSLSGLIATLASEQLSVRRSSWKPAV